MQITNSNIYVYEVQNNNNSVDSLRNQKKYSINIKFGNGAIINFMLTMDINLFHMKNILNLGLIIIDEQHKFGVNQRKKLSDKGGDNCDVLLMTATPIPRTLTMTIYGDMDISIIREKPKSRKPIKTYSKLENKINDVIKFIKKEIYIGNQIFWVCPLIEESKKVDHQSAVQRYKGIQKIFKDRAGLLPVSYTHLRAHET